MSNDAVGHGNETGDDETQPLRVPSPPAWNPPPVAPYAAAPPVSAPPPPPPGWAYPPPAQPGWPVPTTVPVPPPATPGRTGRKVWAIVAGTLAVVLLAGAAVVALLVVRDRASTTPPEAVPAAVADMADALLDLDAAPGRTTPARTRPPNWAGCRRTSR